MKNYLPYILIDYTSAFNLDWLEPGKTTLFNVSDLYNHSPFIAHHSVKYRVYCENNLLYRLKNKDPKILYQLYVPFTLKWQLVGDKEKVYNTNKNIIELVMRDQKMYLLNRYLKENYTQFWKSN